MINAVAPARFVPETAQNALQKSLSEQKLRKAAADFEAILLSKWWSAMRESGLSGSDDSSDPGHDTLDQLGVQALSTAVAKAGGIGIGAMLVRSLLSYVAEPRAVAAGHAGQ